jgi:hypothetical protein
MLKKKTNQRMSKDQLVAAIQSRTARVAVGASTVRGAGNAGTVAAARKFLGSLDLSSLGGGARAPFGDTLDMTTKSLMAALPKGARHWGVARKVLNIFLRDCLYTGYLSKAFDLRKYEALLELPLDRITAVHVKRAAGRGGLPAWPGVKHLKPDLSARFQEVATAEAAKRGIARVHLDAIWWSVSRDTDST